MMTTTPPAVSPAAHPAKKARRAPTPSTTRNQKKKKSPVVVAAGDEALEPMVMICVFKQAYYPPDGFHGYMVLPEKLLVGEFGSMDEANARVRATFLEDNPWGWSPEQVENGEIDIVSKVSPEGHLSLRMQQADSEVWEVFAEWKSQSHKITLKLARTKP